MGVANLPLSGTADALAAAAAGVLFFVLFFFPCRVGVVIVVSGRRRRAEWIGVVGSGGESERKIQLRWCKNCENKKMG